MSVHTPRTPTTAEVYGPVAAALEAQLETLLGPEHHGFARRLLAAADAHVCEALHADEAQRWGALLAHIPGYAPTLHVLPAHVEDGALPYCPGGAACRV